MTDQSADDPKYLDLWFQSRKDHIEFVLNPKNKTLITTRDTSQQLNNIYQKVEPGLKPLQNQTHRDIGTLH